MYNNEKWYAVCDSNFGINEAKVACRSLKTEYIDGRAVPGKPKTRRGINCICYFIKMSILFVE